MIYHQNGTERKDKAKACYGDQKDTQLGIICRGNRITGQWIHNFTAYDEELIKIFGSEAAQ